MGRKPVSPEERTTLILTFRIRNRDLLQKLHDLAKFEVSSVAEIINKSLEEYHKNHDNGSNQTSLTSFTPEGLKNLNQLEKSCLGFFQTRQSLKHGEVVEWLRQNDIEPKKRVELSSKVIKALIAEGVRVEG
jgi:hypothetical protein